jgi:hypothetical protein
LLSIHTSEPGTQEFSKICTNTHSPPPSSCCQNKNSSTCIKDKTLHHP